MRWLTSWQSSWNDLRHGPGSFSERVERQAAFVLLKILGLASVLRLVFLFKYHSDLFYRREWGFWLPAWNWVHGLGMGIAMHCPTSYRAPLYIIFVAPFFALFGNRYVWPLGLAQVIFSVANVYLTYLVGAEWKSKRVGLLGAFLMAVYPYNLYHDVQFYITFLFTFFLLLTVLGFLRTERTRAWQYAALTGASLGLAMLAQSGPLVFFAPFACLWLWRRLGSFKAALKLSAVTAAVALLVMSPWFIRNYRVHHHFVPLTTDAGRVFYKAYNQWALYMLLHNIHVDGTPEPGEGVGTPFSGMKVMGPDWAIPAEGCGFLGMTELENEHYWYGKTWVFIRAHPEQVPVLMLVKFIQLWRPWMWTPKEGLGDNSTVIISAAAEDWGYAISFGFVLALAGFECLAESKEERKHTWLFILLAIAFSITYSVTYAFSKYRVPFDAILAAIAAAGIWRLIDAYLQWKRNRKK